MYNMNLSTIDSFSVSGKISALHVSPGSGISFRPLSAVFSLESVAFSSGKKLSHHKSRLSDFCQILFRIASWILTISSQSETSSASLLDQEILFQNRYHFVTAEYYNEIEY